MSKTLDLIRNAKDGTMVDFRVDNQINSVPIDDLQALLPTTEELVMRQLKRSSTPSVAERCFIAEAGKNYDYAKANGMLDGPPTVTIAD